jgi:glycosyltransferase involved in cell wall biosynthesis
VLARDEEAIIERCLRALAWADERLLMLDASTTDRTEQLAQPLVDRIVKRELTDFASQRNAALDLATGDWVLFVDADEEVSPDLAEEVRATVAQPQGRVGFWVPRHNIICGRWVRYAGWYPDYQLRLLRRGRARFDPRRLVHEVAILDGEGGRLLRPLVHHNYASLGEFRRKQARYAQLEARQLYQQGVRPRSRNFLLQPLREFRRRYVTLGGYREGLLGLGLSLLLAEANFKTYVELRRLWREGEPRPVAEHGAPRGA